MDPEESLVLGGEVGGARGDFKPTISPQMLQTVPSGPLGVTIPPPPGYAGSAPAPSSPLGDAAVPQQSTLRRILLGTPEAQKRMATTPFGGSMSGIIPPVPLGMAMPAAAGMGPLAGMAVRTGLQGLASGAEALLGGQGPMEALKGAGKGAGFNLGAEAILGPVGKFVSRQVGAKGAQAAYKTEEATHAAKVAHDTEMTGALNTLEQQGYKKEVQSIRDKYAEDLRTSRLGYQTGKQATEREYADQVAAQAASHGAATTAHAEQAAGRIAADLESQVPALAGMEKSGKGLYDAIYGSGKKKVSEAYDTALQEVITKGRGVKVELPADVAARLGYEAAADPLVGVSPAVIEALRKAGRLPPGAGGTPGRTAVDAGELAEKLTGLWKKDPGAYRAGAAALDAAGVGDPAARGAFKAYSGVSQFVDRAKALDANGVLNPDNILKALSDLKRVEELRRRGLGSGTEGVIQEAARGGPLAPPPIPKPVTPPYAPPSRPQIPAAPLPRGVPENPAPTPPDITSIPLGWWARHLPGGAIGGALGGGPGAAIGGLLSHILMPKEIVTKGPLSPAVSGAVKAATGPLGAAANAATTPRRKAE